MTSSTRSAREVLDREFLVIRSKLIDVAAAMDRVERADGDPGGDARWDSIQQAIAILREGPPDRAERIEKLFSLPYEEDWRRQFGL